MPAALGAKYANSHDKKFRTGDHRGNRGERRMVLLFLCSPCSLLFDFKEGALQDFGSDPAKGLASSRLQIMEYDLGRAEKDGIDLVEIMVITLKNGGKRLAVVGRSAGWHAWADFADLVIVGANPKANPASV